MLLTAEDRVVRARVVLERRGLAADDLLPAAIAESWRRCLEAGLDPHAPPPAIRVEDAALRRMREQHDLLRRLALAEMESLFHQIAGTNFMIAFAAADGMLLDTIADASFAATAHAASIRPGTLWGELQCGTNALGTVAASRQPVTVHGGEHFFARHGGLTCTAAPVHAPDGTLAGVLDASSDCRSRQQHTRAIVAMAATQIENGLFRERHARDVVLAFHSRAEFLHTLSAGLLALDDGGTVLAANAQARSLLQGLPAMPGRHFAELFRTRLDTLRAGGAEGGRHALQDRVGSVFAARIESAPRPTLHGPTLHGIALPAPLVLAPPPPPPPPSVAPGGMVADDKVVAAALRDVAAAAARRLPILIRGETGTGKEQLARHAHAAAGRRGAFVPVNCASLPDSLIEAELFGHAEGAFTGARRGGAPGLVAEADGGTLFLDEIGDMKLGLQAVLLRLLDDWTLRPVGGGKRRQVDVLLVAATNVDLPRAVEAGRFRPDLYYRLNTLEVTLPPLRERADLGAIARHVLAATAPGCTLTEDAVAALARRPWPGNIRELRSVLTRLTLADPAALITGAHITGADTPPPPPEPTLRAALRARVLATYAETGRNVSATARLLGVSRNTVYRALGAS